MLGISLLSIASAWPLRPEIFILLKFLLGKNFLNKIEFTYSIIHHWQELFIKIMFIYLFNIIFKSQIFFLKKLI